MKKILIFFISSFLIILSCSFILLKKNENQLTYDDEQSGLKEQIIIKFSHVVAENTPKGLAAQHFAKLVQEKTDNEVKVEIYPNGILYSDEEAIEALRQGSIQMIAPASSKLSPYVPEMELLDLPFAFPNYNAVYEAFNGDLGKQLLSLIEKEEDFIGLSLWSNGFKQMTSNRGPLIEPIDMYYQHFRVMPGKVIEHQFSLLNIRTSPIPFNLTYQNLKNGTINGQENTLSNIHSKKFYETQNYMTISNHGFLGYIVMVNKDFWNQLPITIQKVIQDAMAETTEWNQVHALKMNQQALESIQKNSDIKIHRLTRKEKEKWIEALNPVYENFEPIIGKDLLSKLQTLRDKHGFHPN